MMSGMDSLTYRQHRQMALYVHFKQRPMTVLALYWFYRNEYAVILGVALLSLLTALLLQAYYLALVLITAYVIIFLRDSANYRHLAEVWPVVKHVLVWDKVEKLGT